MKIYISSPSFEEHVLLEEYLEKELDVEILSKITLPYPLHHGPGSEEYAKYAEQRVSEKTDLIEQAEIYVFNNSMPTIVSGVGHFECGFAYAIAKPIIVYGDKSSNIVIAGLGFSNPHLNQTYHVTIREELASLLKELSHKFN